jgi:hypothetical protein
MNAKRIIAALALACVLCMAGAAQASPKGVDVPLLAIENGYAMAYSITGNDFGTSFDLSIGIGVTDRIQLYFSNQPGDGGATFPVRRLFSLAYTIAPKIGISTYLGSSGGAAVTGIGLFSSVFEREVGGLTTGLKLKLDYITPLTSFTGGLVSIDIVAAIGI